MKTILSMFAAAALITCAQPAAAGPAFAYSWLSTSKTFDQCITAAGEMMDRLNFPQIQRTKFGVTGESNEDTVFINCEDHRHVSVVLMRAGRPRVGEVDALVALLQQFLATTGQ